MLRVVRWGWGREMRHARWLCLCALVLSIYTCVVMRDCSGRWGRGGGVQGWQVGLREGKRSRGAEVGFGRGENMGLR